MYLVLVVSTSDFDELTLAVQKSHTTGIEYSYVIEKLEIIEISNQNTKANVKGRVIMEMVAGNIILQS